MYLYMDTMQLRCKMRQKSLEINLLHFGVHVSVSIDGNDNNVIRRYIHDKVTRVNATNVHLSLYLEKNNHGTSSGSLHCLLSEGRMTSHESVEVR